jgi:Flp pilus assembly protein TadG
MFRRRINKNQERMIQKNLINKRRSVAMVWTAVTMTLTTGFAALAVDMGYTYSVRAQLQRTVDSAAMAAASQLAKTGTNEEYDIYAEALKFSQKNKIGNMSPTLTQSDIVLGKTIQGSDGKFTFDPNQTPADSVKVTVRLTKDSPNGAIDLFFGRILGVEEVEMSASAVATLVPRDVAIVIDLSRSMDYDSQLRYESTTSINIKEVWEDLGSPQFGNMKVFTDSKSGMSNYTDSNYSTIIQKLGLTNVPYPYPGGSWTEYVKYVKQVSISGVPAIPDMYKNYYGLRTFVNYLLAARTLTTETPKLAGTRAQPVHALKQAVDELCGYLMLMDSGDQLSLQSYSDAGKSLKTLTGDYTLISQTVYAQQAGGYGANTNISAGIEQGISELLSSRARKSAKKVIFVLTDGQANRPSNETTGRQYAINSATNAINKNIQIYTISLGSEADQALMAQIAGIGKGVHYYVPTLNISQYSEDLKKVFRTLGGKRPVRLVE